MSRSLQRILCSDSARQIDAARRAGAAVINMSYGSTQRCTTEADAIQRAVRAGIVPVAASGNEFDQGNPAEFPAMLPHVLTVAALADDDRPTFFSSESAAVDVSAPGLNVLTAVPARRARTSTPTARSTASRPSAAPRSRPRWSRAPWRGSAPRGLSSRRTRSRT